MPAVKHPLILLVLILAGPILTKHLAAQDVPAPVSSPNPPSATSTTTPPQPGAASPATASAPATSLPVAYETEPLPSDPTAALLLASKANGLGGEELKPWYLKAHYQIYDAQGKPAAKGIFELYWAAKDHYRVSYSSDAFRQTIFRRSGEISKVGSQEAVPYTESKIWDELIHPIVIRQKMPKPQFRDQKISKVPLTCIELQGGDYPYLTSYCLDSTHLSLRTRETDGVRVLYNRIALFERRFVPMQTAVSDGQQRVLDVDIDTLRGIQPGDLQALVPSPDAVPSGKGKTASEITDTGVAAAPAVQAPAKVLPGHIVFKADPTYPEEARQKRVQGVVRV